MHDIFQPKQEPARSIYDAFQIEARKRNGRSFGEWLVAEREAVMRETTIQAAKLGLRAPSLAEIMYAENHACGSVDYGAKWAQGVAEAMRNKL